MTFALNSPGEQFTGGSGLPKRHASTVNNQKVVTDFAPTSILKNSKNSSNNVMQVKEYEKRHG